MIKNEAIYEGPEAKRGHISNRDSIWPRQRATSVLLAVALLGLLAGSIRSMIPARNAHSGNGIAQIVPEYDRTMDIVVVSLAHRDTTLANHTELLRRLPSYTRVLLLVPKDNISLIEDELLRQQYASRVELCPYDPKPMNSSSIFAVFPSEKKLLRADQSAEGQLNHCGSIWAQDLFEVAVDDHGHTLLLAAEIHKYYYKSGDATADMNDKEIEVNRDNEFLENLEGPHLTVQGLPLAFKGGNLLVDQKDGRRILFCGSTTINTTRAVLRAQNGLQQSDADLRNSIKAHFAADSLVVLGDKQQPDSMYHIDQAMIILANGVVGVERIVDVDAAPAETISSINDVVSFLASTRTALRNLGYEIFDIEVTAQNVARFQHYANAIPYIDKNSGTRTVLMPVYTSADSEIDRNIVKKNAEAFRSQGYEVVLVPTSLDELRGGIHCLANVIK